MMTHPTLFCPNCRTYLGPLVQNCQCSWVRPSHERLLKPGESIWEAQLAGAVHGALVAGEQVIFHYGSRSGGGVCSINRETGEHSWSIETPYSVESGVVLYEGYLYFATCGFMRADAELYCLQLDNGQVRWKQKIGAGVYSKPIVEEARLYIAQEDGMIRGFDSRQGEPISHEPASLSRGRIWLIKVDQLVIAVSKTGQILALNPQGLRPLWNYDVGCEITSAPCRVGNKLYFGGQDGQVITLDLHGKNIMDRHDVFASGLGKVAASPAVSLKTLFIGAHDHHLHAYDLQSRQEIWNSDPFEHSISTAPFSVDGLVVVSINQAGTALLDGTTGELIWHFPVGKDVKLMSEPILVDGVIYTGTDKGRVYALPWHLGKYEWAGLWCREHREFEQAGMFYVLCAQKNQTPEKQYYQLAEECWRSASRMDRVGQLLEYLIEEKRAADAYREAGQQWIGRDNQQAAVYFLRASDLYWKLDDEQQASGECAGKAQKLVHGPLLRIKPWTIPKMTQFEKGNVTFTVENIGSEAAENLTINLGGSLMEPVVYRVLDPLPAGRDSGFIFTLTIVPTQAKNDIIIRAEYTASSQNIKFNTKSRTVVEAYESVDVEISNVAMSDIKLNITNTENKRVRYKLDMIASSSIQIGDSGTQQDPVQPRCSKCHEPLPPKAKHCDKCGTKL